MLVPRSFKYTSASTESMSEKGRRRSLRTSVPNIDPSRPPPRPPSPRRTTTEPVSIPSPRFLNGAVPERSYSEIPPDMPTQKSARVTIGRRKGSSHDPNALPPAVAALLAVTYIPPRRPNRYRSTPGSQRRVSIEELISEWKSDGSLKSTFAPSSSPALSILLEDADDAESRDGTDTEPNYLNARSASSESMPSLDSDNRSMLSVGSPSTPGSLRSKRSCPNLKNSRARSLPNAEECALDHPLIPRPEHEEDEGLLLSIQKKTAAATNQKSSFKSNLTASLQSLKEAAVSSISSFGRVGSAPSLSSSAAPPMDDMLWSHPFLFPRFSSEVRPVVDGTPTEAQRRYLNPIPLTFEEQEAPFQQALHAPFLAEAVDDVPTIQMQTYTRGRRRASPRRSNPNPSSEAGRALLGAAGVRQREVRENPDFLRVVVLEMNMRREGKIEQGRAKIWLPPRQTSPAPAQIERVPRRWIGTSA